MIDEGAGLRAEEIKTFFINLGILIKWGRMRKNITQEKMQDALGLNMHNVETGTENLTLTSILRIAKYLEQKPHKMILYALTEQKIYVFQEEIEKMKILGRSKKRTAKKKNH